MRLLTLIFGAALLSATAAQAHQRGCPPVPKGLFTQGVERFGPEGVNQRLRDARRPIPHGLERSWDDCRLNPLRAVRTERGDAQMREVWTDTVPRRRVRD